MNGLDVRQMSDFDRIIDRRSSESVKWNLHGEDVLPMWVADMDFASPPPVIEALRQRVEHGVYGYAKEPDRLRGVLVERMQRLYDWTIQPDDILFLPNVVVSFHLASHALTAPGDEVLIQPPIYFPILHVPQNVGLRGDLSPLVCGPDGRYTIDFDTFEASISDRTRLFILCNPHNPVARVYTRQELERLADICLRRDVTICSDEIHADFVYDGRRHVPIASLSPEVAAKTVTILSPSKTFNIAGIGGSVTIVPDPEMRKAISEAHRGLVSHVGVMGYTAALAAFEHGGPWLQDLIVYLQKNRDFLESFVAERLPDVRVTPTEGTFLAWLDCRRLGLNEAPSEFFLREARVAMNDGAVFGEGGGGHVRLNFGCPRSTLREGLERIARSLG